MADSFIRRQEGKPDGLSVAQCLRMFGVSRSGYYSWIGRQKDADGSCAVKQENLNDLKEKFRQIVRKLGFVPGKRTFRTYLWREFHVNVSVKRCRKIMNEMNLVANKGSQYLSTTFQKLLEDDGFIQSVSGRGNSQDNAPMESFFGRMKCELLNLIARCPNTDTVKRVIDGYIDAYNNRHYQYALAGLTPSEYYAYVTTGIYPVDNYYGVQATELMPIKALVTARLNAAAEKARKVKAANEKRRKAAEKIQKSPLRVVARDQRILHREISKWMRSKEIAIQKMSHLKRVLEKAQKAEAYLMSASAEVLTELSDGYNWEKHPQLAYIYEMRELF